MRKMLVSAAVAGLLMAACGGDDDPEVTGGGDTTAPAGEAGMDHGSSSATCSPSGSDVQVVASGTKFNSECFAGPAGRTFKLMFDNKDGVAHNIAILKGHDAADPLFRAELVPGSKMMTFDVGPLEPGTYAFHCEVHPSQMSGNFVIA